MNVSYIELIFALLQRSVDTAVLPFNKNEIFMDTCSLPETRPHQELSDTKDGTTRTPTPFWNLTTTPANFITTWTPALRRRHCPLRLQKKAAVSVKARPCRRPTAVAAKPDCRRWRISG